MRRGLPWALVGLVAAATGIGAWLGVSSAPAGGSAQAWVAQVLATTQAAGTVRFTYSSVTTSSNPHLRSSATGSGAVDFAGDGARATEIRAGDGSSDGLVRLGRTVYISFAAPGQPQAIWIKIGRPPDSGQDLLGLDFTNAAGALTGFSGPFHAVRVEDLGSAVVNGIPSTGYRVISGPTCTSSRSDPPSDNAGPTDLWVDGGGRLVQVRSTFSATMGPPPTGTPSVDEFPRSDWGTATTTDILRFSGYGTPVTITAPPARRPAVGHSATTFAISSSC
jgi:hypothetical protein